MSRAFESLTVAAACVFIILLLSRAIKMGAEGVSAFIEKNYIIIYTVLAIIALIISCVLYFIAKKDNELTKGIISTTSVTVYLAIAQNFTFLVYGFYRALTAYIDAPFLTIIAVGGFVLIYAINVFVTIVGVMYSYTVKWGAIIPSLIAVAGVILILIW